MKSRRESSCHQPHGAATVRTSPCLSGALKSQDERHRGSKMAPWAGVCLTSARTCRLAFTCSPAQGGHEAAGATRPPNHRTPTDLGAQSTVGRDVLKADVSKGVAPGREGSGILIVWHESAHCSLGGVRRVHGSLEVAKASFHSLQKQFLRWLASLGGG